MFALRSSEVGLGPSDGLKGGTSVLPPGTGSAALSAALPSLPSNASAFDVLMHRVSTRVADAGDEAIDAIGAPPFYARPADGRGRHTASPRARGRPAASPEMANLDPPQPAPASARRCCNAQRPGDLPVGDATFVFEPQDLACSSHRHSLGWNCSPTRHSRGKQSAAYHPAVERLPTLQGWPTSKSEWPRSNRNQWLNSFPIGWLTSPGIRISGGPRACTMPANQRHRRVDGRRV